MLLNLLIKAILDLWILLRRMTNASTWQKEFLCSMEWVDALILSAEKKGRRQPFRYTPPRFTCGIQSLELLSALEIINVVSFLPVRLQIGISDLFSWCFLHHQQNFQVDFNGILDTCVLFSLTFYQINGSLLGGGGGFARACCWMSPCPRP